MAITGIFIKRQPKIADIVFDALIEEETQMESEVSEYPLEVGTVATDHIIQRPLSLTMTVGVSDNVFRVARAAASDVGINSGLFGVAASQIVGAAISSLSGTTAAIIGAGASVASGQASTRSQTILESLRTIQRAGALIDVVSTKATYKNCAIVNTYQRTTKENERGLEVVVEMRQVLVNNLQRIEATDGALATDDTVSTMGQTQSNIGTVTME